MSNLSRGYECESLVALRREYRDKIAHGSYKVKCTECGGRLTKIPDDEWEIFLTAGCGLVVRHTECRP